MINGLYSVQAASIAASWAPRVGLAVASGLAVTAGVVTSVGTVVGSVIAVGTIGVVGTEPQAESTRVATTQTITTKTNFLFIFRHLLGPFIE
jgi:hypothetical protein